MNWFLGIFDPGWRDLSVRMSNTEISLIWLLAGIIGFLLYHFLIGRRQSATAGVQARVIALEQEVLEEKNRQHKLKSQLEAAMAKANSFSASAGELEKQKHRLHDIQKELDGARAQAMKFKADFDAEHNRVTSMMVDHGEVEELKNRVKNQEKEIQQSRLDHQKLRSELDLAISEKARLSASQNEQVVHDLKDKVQKLENDLHTSRLLVVKFQTESNGLAEERKKIQEEALQLEEQKKERDRDKSIVEKLEQDLKSARLLAAELPEVKSGLAAMKAEKDKWQQESDIQAANARQALDLRDQLSAAEAELKQARETIAGLQSRLAEGADTAGQLDKEKLAAKALMEQLTTLGQRTGKLEADLQLATSENQSLKEQLMKLELEKSRMTAELAQASIPIRPDNLKRIEGIGPKLEEMLNAKQILTFSQLAGTPVATLQQILDEGGEQYRIHDPETWPEQARLLAEGKVEEFERLTLALKGGRRVE